MIQTPQIAPVSTLARDHKAVFALLAKGPVFLASRSRPAAVLVSTEQWDQLVRRLAEAEGIIESRRVLEQVARGEMGTIRHDDLINLLAKKQADAAVVGN